MEERFAQGPDGNDPGLPKRSDKHKERERKQSRGVLRALKEIGIIIVAALLLSTFIRFFVVQVYSIPSGSMLNTLQINDRIAVNRLPSFGKDIERGDVVVFSDDNNWLTDDGSTQTVWQTVGRFLGIFPANGEEVLVKRVIGLSGDTVECCTEEGQLTVNGVPIDEPYLIEGATASEQEFAVTVPAGTLWVMGDNRPGSADSRAHLTQGDAAFVPKDAVIGKVWGVIWPFSHWSGVSDRDAFAGLS